VKGAITFTMLAGGGTFQDGETFTVFSTRWYRVPCRSSDGTPMTCSRQERRDEFATRVGQNIIGASARPGGDVPPDEPFQISGGLARP
jgi:hypothetical protein